MTVAEIIAEQKRKCDAAKAARKGPPSNTHRPPPPPPKKMSQAEIERAYIEDRTYDGKAPEGGMARVMRKENPDEYVARDGTRTFCPWRYVSMQDLELPDNGNPYRKSEEEPKPNIAHDPWGRPSGYVASAAGPGGVSPEYDPWSMPAQGAVADNTQWSSPVQGNMSAPAQDASWDDWLAPNPNQVPSASQPTGFEQQPQPDIGMGTLDIMRNMRK